MVFTKTHFRWATRFLQFGLSAFFVAWIMVVVDPALVWGIFSQADLTFIFLAIIVLPVGWGLRSWRYLLLVNAFDRTHEKSVRFHHAFKGFLLFLSGNAALPLRGGEWLRIAHIKAQYPRLPTAFLVGAAGAEKVPETIYSVLVIGLWIFLEPSDFVVFGTLIVSVFFAASLSLTVLVSGSTALPKRVLTPGVAVISTTRLFDVMRTAASAFAVFGHLRDTVLVASATLLTRLIDTIVMLVVASALDIPLSVEASLLIGATLSLGLTFSALPAHIGVFEASVVAGAAFASIEAETALAFGLGFHAVVLTGWLCAIAWSVPLLLQPVSGDGGAIK
ncbi:flippase-like domain-containing protein [Parvibaculum lavamentivorans]|nr:flippase-like domain-containing protein [Parvibaculum lavamentivorans]